jgi:hypothetical protein
MLSTICQLYRGGQFDWRRKPEYPEKPTDLPQVTDYHINVEAIFTANHKVWLILEFEMNIIICGSFSMHQCNQKTGKSYTLSDVFALMTTLPLQRFFVIIRQNTEKN